MATTALPSLLVRPGRSFFAFPADSLAYVIAFVAITTGWFLALHLLGTLNILFGHPRITRTTVVLSSAAGILISAYLLNRIGLCAGRETARPGKAVLPTGVKIIIALAAIPYLSFFLDTLWSFPNGTDALGYHINNALQWLQNGTMRVDLTLGWKYGLPSNAELPALLALSLGIEKAVALGDFFAAILLALSVYLIAWRLTGRNAPSILSAVVANTIPIVVFQAFELYVDLFGAAFLLAAIALFTWREKSPDVCTFLSGCAIGIAVGSKPVFLAYAAIYAAAALGAIWWLNWRVRFAVLLLAGIILASSFWFFRATAATGNPLYPISIPIGKQDQSAGYSPTAIAHVSSPSYRLRALFEVLAYPWTEVPHNDGLPVGPDRGTGPLFAAIAVPGVLFLLMRAWRQRALSLEAALIALTVVTLAVWVIQLRITRFALPVMALSCALAAPMIGHLLDQWRRVLIALFLAGVSLNGLYCLVEPVQRIAHRIRLHDWSRAAYYGYPPFLDNLPPGSRILDRTFRDWDSMLAGARLTNSVRPLGDPARADFVIKAGPRDTEDAQLDAAGAALIYNATPANLFPKVAVPWRVYRLH